MNRVRQPRRLKRFRKACPIKDRKSSTLYCLSGRYITMHGTRTHSISVRVIAGLFRRLPENTTCSHQSDACAVQIQKHPPPPQATRESPLLLLISACQKDPTILLQDHVFYRTVRYQSRLHIERFFTSSTYQYMSLLKSAS